MLDAFNHFLPPATFERSRTIRPDGPVSRSLDRLAPLANSAARLLIVNRFDAYRHVLRRSNPPIVSLGRPEDTPVSEHDASAP